MSTTTKTPTEYGSHSSRNPMANLDCEEKGFATHSSATAVGSHQQNPSHHHLHFPRFHKNNASTSNNNNTSLLPPNDKLRVYRALTGIETPLGLIPETPSSNPFKFHKKSTNETTRVAANIGIYRRVIDGEAIAQKRYRYFSTLINTCLAIQIVVAASLTAIGAARGPYKAITAFGAINTIMAGILTYLKGSGLPGREKFYENEWAKLRMYIEQRERELCLVGSQLDVEEEIETVERMFRDIRREMEGGSGEARGQPNDGDRETVRERRKRRLLPVPDWKEEERRGEESSESVLAAPAPAHAKDEERLKAVEAYDGNEKR